MQRINTPTRAIGLFGPGKDGFKNGNLAGADPATDLNATWFNLVQEEIARTIEAAGIDLDGEVRTQLLQAFRRLAGGNVRTVAAGNTGLTHDDAGLVLVDASAGNVAISLPLVATVRGLPFTFRRVDGSANTVTIARAGSSTDVIDGPGITSLPLMRNEVVKLRSNGLLAWLIESWVGSRFARFVAGGSFPVFVPEVFLTGCGAGGGGGGNSALSAGNILSGGGGGGAGQAVQKLPVAVTPGTVQAVSVGAGGAGGSAVSPAGQAGGSTTFGALQTLTGGGGGGVGASASASSGSAAGGFPGSGYPFGAIGQDACSPGAGSSGGCGGSGPFGGGGPGGRGADSTGSSALMIGGYPGHGFGSGGGGAGGLYSQTSSPSGGTGASGGDGAPGWLLVEW